MNKTIKRITCFIMALCMLVVLTPVLTKADTTYTMITPGKTLESAALIPVDGKDYVASFDTKGEGYLYFKFVVPHGTENFYTVFYKNLSVDAYTDFEIDSIIGEKFGYDNYLGTSATYTFNRKLEEGTYILKIHKSSENTGNVKLNISSRKDSVGDTREKAKNISSGKTVTSSLDGMNDVDYYKFVAPATGVYEFYAKNLSIHAYTRYAIYSSSEEELYYRDYLGYNYEDAKALNCHKGDTYYIRYAHHYENASDVGKYKISVKKVDPGKVKTLNVKKLSKNNVKMTWSKVSGVTGYEVQISNSKKFNTYDNYTMSGRSMKGCYEKGRYYVRVRAYKQVGDEMYYGKFSSVKSFKVK